MYKDIYLGWVNIMNQQFELLLPVIKQPDEHLFENVEEVETVKGFLAQPPTDTNNVPIDLNSFKSFFEQFGNLELDTIEVFIKGAVETKGVMKIIAGLEGEASMKLILKQKKS
jgi:hypothetical protein